MFDLDLARALKSELMSKQAILEDVMQDIAVQPSE